MFNTRRGIIASIALAVVSVSTQSLSAQQYMYATGGGGTTIIRINTLTGAATTIGPSNGGGQTFAGAFTADGSFWTLNGGFNNSQLASVNLTTGAATAIGPATGLPNTMALAGSGNKLYAASWDGRFWDVNTTTGAFSLVGNMGFGNVMDMATRTDGSIIGTNGTNVWSINPGNASSSLLFNMNLSGMPMGMAFNNANDLFVTTWEQNSQFYQVDQTNGALTSIGALGVNFAHGGDILLNTVPEPASIVLVAGGVLALAGARRLRGRRLA